MKAEAGVRSAVSELLQRRVGLQVLMRRKWLGWDQRQLALETGTSQAQISRIESGQSDVKLSTIAKLAEAFGCAPHELLKTMVKNHG